MKKVKLFTTIASLCLAVALMAFGVYAAQNVVVTASGTVNFEVGANVAGTLSIVGYSEQEAEYGVTGTAGTAATLPIYANGADTLTLPLNAVKVNPNAPHATYVVSFDIDDGLEAAGYKVEFTITNAAFDAEQTTTDWTIKTDGTEKVAISYNAQNSSATEVDLTFSFKVNLTASKVA